MVLISTHALLAEGDLDPAINTVEDLAFQPTPSLRRATQREYVVVAQLLFQPTPSLRRATQGPAGQDGAQGISTHALLAEGDLSFALSCEGGK